jgi:phage terminase large subunit
LLFSPHSEKQEEALFSEARITLIATGIQWGKTFTGALRMKMKMHEFTRKDDAFIIAAPTYKIMKQSTLPAFLKLMRGYGKYNKSEASFEMHGGGIAYMRTETDPDSVVGITNVRHIWGDEAGKYSLYFWENLQGRAAFGSCDIDLTTSPYSLNWIHKDLIRPHLKGQIAPERLKYVKAASYENPYFPLSEYENRKATMDPRRFRMMFGGEWERMEGLVYDCFDISESVVDWPEHHQGVRHFAGIDWGFTEPFALWVMALYPDGRRYQVSEVKRARLGLSEVIELCKEKKSVFHVEHFYCDPSQPASIKELNKAGLSASGADNSVRLGIDKTYEMIKTGRLKFVKGQCTHTIDEMESYHYPDPKDIKPDKAIREDMPVAQNDHMCDAMRYCIISTIDRENLRKPHVPQAASGQATQLQRIAALQKGKRSYD